MAISWKMIKWILFPKCQFGKIEELRRKHPGKDTFCIKESDFVILDIKENEICFPGFSGI